MSYSTGSTYFARTSKRQKNKISYHRRSIILQLHLEYSLFYCNNFGVEGQRSIWRVPDRTFLYLDTIVAFPVCNLTKARSRVYCILLLADKFFLHGQRYHSSPRVTFFRGRRHGLEVDGSSGALLFYACKRSTRHRIASVCIMSCQKGGT